MWRFLNINRNPEKSPSRWHLCKQEAESHSVSKEGLERRVEVLLEGLLLSLYLLQASKPLLSAFLLLGLDPIQSAGPPAHGPQWAVRNVGSWWLGEGRGSNGEDNSIEGSQGWILRGPEWVLSKFIRGGNAGEGGRRRLAKPAFTQGTLLQPLKHRFEVQLRHI